LVGWLRPSEAAEVANRWAADTAAHDFALSERLGRALLAWLGVVAFVLGLAACAPEAPCTVRPQPGIEAAWCPGTTPTISVAPGCPVATVRAAAALWHPLLDGADIFTGDGEADIELRVGDVPGTPIGHTDWWHIGHALIHAEITVEACDVHVIAHELVALGFGHVPDVTSLMFESTEAESWAVTPEQLAAYHAARGAP
jgi:hypothetical protein